MDSGVGGIYPMLYAFFDAGDRLRMDAFHRQVDAALANGAAGVAVLGLGTEVQKLSGGERRSVVEEVAAHLAGRLPLAVTIAGQTPRDQLELARFARGAGATWVILQPPPERCEEDALIAFFGEVADGLDCPVGIQNAPEFLGYGLTGEGLLRLAARHPNVTVVKAETSAVAVEEICRAAGDSLAVFNGRCGLELPDNLRAGVKGMIPGIETVDLQSAIAARFAAGDITEAEQLYRRLAPVVGFMMQGIPHFIAYGKLVAALRLSLEPSAARAPAMALTPFGEACARRFADELGPLAF